MPRARVRAGMDIDLRTTALSFAGALVVLVAIVAFVGVRAVLDALVRADPSALAAVLAAATVWLVAWGLALRTVLGVLDAPVSAPVAVLTYAAATFANNVTPFGHAGGEPVSALLISRVADAEYESSLAAIASVDSVNFVPSITLSALGLAFLSTKLVFGRRLRIASLAVAILALAVPVAGYVGWRHRYDIERRVVDALTPAVRRVGGALPRVDPPTPAAIRRRIEGFFHAIERVAADGEALAFTLGFSTLGWLAQTASLWFSLSALGQSVAYSVVVVVVPVAAIASIAPLPGGLGGVEAVLIALLVALGVPAGVASAAVLIHRTAVYWLPMLVGGAIAGFLGGSEGNRLSGLGG